MLKSLDTSLALAEIGVGISMIIPCRPWTEGFAYLPFSLLDLLA